MSKNELNLLPLLAIAFGGEQVLDRINRNVAMARQNERRFPFHDIIKFGDSKYRLNMAIAGYNQEDVSIELHNNTLTITGKPPIVEDDANYIHKGISLAPFERKFDVLEYMDVTSASYKNGILTIDLEQSIPEDKKPKIININ